MCIGPGEIKGLFWHLVQACGGVEAAGARLGISHQRVSQLQKTDPAEPRKDLPNLIDHIMPLESWCGQAIVTGALARVATGGSVSADPVKEAGDVIVNASRVFDLVRTKADPKTIKAAIIEHRREVDELDQSVDGAA